jgi:hypothetical protein
LVTAKEHPQNRVFRLCIHVALKRSQRITSLARRQ